MSTIFKREFKAYFRHPLGMAPTALLLLVTGALSTLIHMFAGSTQFAETLYFLQWILFLVLPLLCISRGDRKAERLLRSLPLSATDVVLGKYFAALSVFALNCLIIAAYPLVLSLFGMTALTLSYMTLLAFFFLGAALLALCMLLTTVFSSSWIGALLSGGVIALLLAIDLLLPMTGAWGARLLRAVSLFTRYTLFCHGVVDISTLLYDVTVAVFCLYVAVQIRAARCTRKGGAL